MSASRKFNILHFVDTLVMGGVQRNLLSLIRRRDKEKVNISVVYSYGGDLEAEFEREGVRLYKIQASMIRFKDFRYLNIIFKLLTFIKRNDIDLIHAHNFVPYVFSYFVSKMAGVPIVNHIHADIYGPSRVNLGRKEHWKMLKFLCRGTDLTITIVRSAQKTLMDAGIPPDKTLYIPNGIEVPAALYCEKERIEGIRKRHSVSQSNVICAIGRLSKEKNFSLLLNAIPTVLTQVPDTVLFVVGDGPLRNALWSEVERLGIKRNVKFTGMVSDIYPILCLSDLFVLSSIYEGHPISILEAMTMKKAIIATDVGGIRDIVKDSEIGLVVPSGNQKALSSAIIDLLQNKKKRLSMGAAGYKLVNDKFNNKNIVPLIEAQYARLIGKSRTLDLQHRRYPSAL